MSIIERKIENLFFLAHAEKIDMYHLWNGSLSDLYRNFLEEENNITVHQNIIIAVRDICRAKKYNQHAVQIAAEDPEALKVAESLMSSYGMIKIFLKNARTYMDLEASRQAVYYAERMYYDNIEGLDHIKDVKNGNIKVDRTSLDAIKSFF